MLNVVSFLAYGIDKYKARRDKLRISEARLLQLSFIGPLGSVPGIWWLRHKTQKTSFLVKYGLVIALSIAVHGGIFWLVLQYDKS